MTTRIKIKKGAGTPSGLTFGELAYDVTNKRLFIGITGGNALLANTDGGVASFNGLTGAVTGVTVGGTNVFTALNTFNAGISAAGATFSGDIAVNGGDITTTSGTATLFNGNATTLDILNTQSSGFTLNIGNASTFSGTKRINIGSNIGGGASSEIIIGSANSASRVSILGGITLGNNVGSGGVRVAGTATFEVNPPSIFSGLLSANAGISAAGGTFGRFVTINAIPFGAGGTASYTPTNFLGFGDDNRSNVAIGRNALSSNIPEYSFSPFTIRGVFNTGVGYQALQNLSGVTGSVNSISNTALGYASLSALKIGNSNVGIGTSSLFGLTAGNENIGIGSNAGSFAFASGNTAAGAINSGIYIGTNTRASAPTASEEIVIGYQAVGLGSNTTVIGSNSQTSATIYGLLNAPSGISASGATFSGNVRTQGVLYTDNIENRTGQIYIDNTTVARVSIGEYEQNGNNTCIFLRDATSTLDITNPIGDIRIGDINGYGGGQIFYNATSSTLSGNGGSNIIDFYSISATNELLENNRRVTTNARSWFL